MKRWYFWIFAEISIAILLGLGIWTVSARWRIEKQAPTPAPSPTAISTGNAWRFAPGMPGTRYLAVCHDYQSSFVALQADSAAPLVKASGNAYPQMPHVSGFLAMSGPLHLPRLTENPGRDMDAWLKSGAKPDCKHPIWTGKAVQAIRAGRQIAFFGMPRPDKQSGKPVWKLVFYAIRWQ